MNTMPEETGAVLGVGARTTPVWARVEAPARLHLGFLDLEGGLGRRFVGLGLAIDGLATDLRVERAARTQFLGLEAARVEALHARFCRLWPLPPVRVEVVRAIPPHAGLGSGTQLALALGRALAELVGLRPSTAAIARIARRGARSGIGVAAFEQGGLLLDGGTAAGEEEPPPIVSRLIFPDDWRLLLVLDPSRAGLAGEAERRAFARMPPFPADQAAHLCRLALVCVLPGIARRDFALACRGIGEIQRILGEWYAPLQGGQPFTSPAVGEAVAWLRAQGLQGIGQSSWGPTGFALLPDSGSAARLRDEAQRRFADRLPELQFAVVRGRGRGAIVASGGTTA